MSAPSRSVPISLDIPALCCFDTHRCATRERIYRVWRSIADPAPRVRYYQLHQAFSHLPIAVLEVVIRDYEADA